MNYVQIVERCCQDLRRYLEEMLKTARGGVVTVKSNRVLQAALPLCIRRRYSWCFSRVLRQWRWNRGVYVVPRRDAETLLANLDELCASIKSAKRRAEATRRNVAVASADGRMVLVSFHLPSALAQALDSYVQRSNTTRATVVREAIAHLIEKYRNIEVDIQQRPAAPVTPPVALEDELVSIAFHETRYVVELLDRYAAALKVSRADVVRAAIQQMLDRVRVEAVAAP